MKEKSKNVAEKELSNVVGGQRRVPTIISVDKNDNNLENMDLQGTEQAVIKPKKQKPVVTIV